MAIKKIRQRQEDILEILGGNIKSVEDYRFHIGELTALRTMESEIRESARRINDDELSVPNHIAEKKKSKRRSSKVRCR